MRLECGMEKLDLAINTTVCIKEKHKGFVKTAMDYVAAGGNLTDIFSNLDQEAVMRGEEKMNLVFLKTAPVGERRATIVVAQAIINGAKVKLTSKSDIFCAGCNGNCAK